MSILKILADQDIACVADAFRDLGELRLMPGRDIGREHLRDCQCLILRTVTRVDAELLDDSAIEFVGTATIGTDHVDLDYLREATIGFGNAAGCNAESASEYVVSGLFALSERLDFDPFQRKVGIVGFGNVGSRLYHSLTQLGIECLVCDPPLAETGTNAVALVELNTLLQDCDLISLHVPLTHTGRHPTHHLLDLARLRQLNSGTLLINAARGAVIDNAALLRQLQQRNDLHVFLDTFEHEPRVPRDLLRRADLATPHIAGYSIEGRLRGTQMVHDAACDHFGLRSGWHMSQHLPAVRTYNPPASANKLDFWRQVLAAHCNIWRDHDALSSGVDLPARAFAGHFDALRKRYADRTEYSHFRVDVTANSKYRETLESMGFQTQG